MSYGGGPGFHRGERKGGFLVLAFLLVGLAGPHGPVSGGAIGGILTRAVPVVLARLLLRGRGLGGAVLLEIGRAHVCIPVTNAHLVCRLLIEKNNTSLLCQT